MQFTFDEEQLLAAQALRDVLTDHCTGADLRRAAEAKDLADFETVCATRRRSLRELALETALLSESAGGLGLAPIDAVLLAEEAGRAALPEPLIETMALAVPLLSELTDQDARAMGVLDAVSSGDEIRVCWPGANLVHDITGAIHVLGGATDQDIAVKRATDLRSEPVVSVDPLRRLARADWESADSVAALRGARVSELWHQARLRARVFDAAQLIGLADRMTALAVAYSLERKQFGKAIGANQAVKHQLANVQIKIEFARPVVYAAAAALPSRLNGLDMDERPYSAKWLETRVHHALVAACDAADLAARTAIQVHGAMGYSWELDLQFYAKRSWVLAGLHGGRSQSFAAVHRSLVHDGLALGPDRSFG